MSAPRCPRAPCGRRRGAGTRLGPNHQRRVGSDAQLCPGPSWDALKTRSSGAGTLTESKCSLPRLALPQPPRSHSPPPTRSSARWQRGAEEPLSRRGYSPSWPSPDAKSTPLLQILSPKLPGTAGCSCPTGPGRIGSTVHLTGIAASSAVAWLSSRPERADKPRTRSANEAEHRAALTRLRRGRNAGGGASFGPAPVRRGVY